MENGDTAKSYGCAILHCAFKLRFAKPANLKPFIATTFRGGLGYTLKKIACGSIDRQCSECIISANCAYRYLFETTPHNNSEIMRKYNHVPHPFILFCPQTDMHEVDEYTLNATLIGKGAEYLPHFLYAIIELGKSGLGRDKIKYSIEEVTIDGDAEPIYRDGDNKIRSDISTNNYEFTIDEKSHASSECKLTLWSPLRLIYEGKLLREPLFRPFMSSLLRRISTIFYFHCNQTLDLDFATLVNKASEVEVIDNKTKWYDQSRYSTRQQENMKLGGLVGEFTVKGNLAPFMGLLKMGEQIHNGKGTVFGLGKYTLGN